MIGYDPTEDPFVHEIRRQAERAHRSRTLGFWEGITLVGAIGWMVCLPALLGVMLGRFVDAHSGSAPWWTLGLLVAGLVVGCISAWRHVKQVLTQ